MLTSFQKSDRLFKLSLKKAAKQRVFKPFRQQTQKRTFEN